MWAVSMPLAAKAIHTFSTRAHFYLLDYPIIINIGQNNDQNIYESAGESVHIGGPVPSSRPYGGSAYWVLGFQYETRSEIVF